MKRRSEAEQTCYGFWRVIDSRPIWQWGEEHVRLPHSARHTEFRVATAPQVREPLSVLSDNRIEEVVVIKPVQGGGSTIAEVFVPWIIAENPGPLQWNWETEEKAKRMAETRIRRMLEATEPVAKLLATMDRFKKRTQSIIFPHMSFFVQGADSLANLQSDSIRWQINDEIWNWKPGRLNEARHRTDAFDWNRRILNISTAGVAGLDGSPGDDSHQTWLRSDQREWAPPCPKCGLHQRMKFRETPGCSHIWLDHSAKKDGGKGWDFRKLMEHGRVRWVCCGCGHQQVDDPRVRREMNERAVYVAQNRDALGKFVGFMWNCWSVAWKGWADRAIEFLKRDELAKLGNTEPLKEFVQKELVEFWSENGHAAYEVKERPKASYNFADTTGQAFDFLILTGDVQHKDFWVIVRGWMKTGASRLVYAGNPLTWGEIEETRIKYGVEPRKTLVDSGYTATEVYRQALRFGWVCLKGEDKTHFMHRLRNGKTVRRIYSELVRGDPGVGTKEQGRRFAPLILFSTPVCQGILQRLIDGQGAPWEVAGDVPEFYWQQIHSWIDKPKKNKETGIEELRWVQVRQQDHLRACEVMQVAAAMMLGVLVNEETTLPTAATQPTP